MDSPCSPSGIEFKEFRSPPTKENALVHYLQNALNPNNIDVVLEREEVERLINAGGDVNATLENNGRTVIHILALHWNREIANLLALKGADINKADSKGRTPLHTAAANNRVKALEWLIARGAELEAKTDGELNTPLHYAARHDAIMAMGFLLEKGSDLEARDYRGRTPLHLACQLDRALAVQTLMSLKTPANIQAQDDCGETAMASMISNTPRLAFTALDQFREVNINRRVEKFYLCKLEPDNDGVRSPHKTPIEVAIDEKKKHLLTHPVMKNMLNIKWKFVRPFFFLHLAVHFLFIILWSIDFAYPTVQEKHIYTFPRDSWRVIVQVLIMVLFLGGVSSQMVSLIQSIRSHRAHNEFTKKDIRRDLDTLILTKDEKEVLEGKLSLLKIFPEYVKDPWTSISVCTNILIVVVIALQIANVASHSPGLALMEARFGCFATIMLWMQLVKFLRASRHLGPIVAIIIDVFADIIFFLIIASIFYIPFVLSFWVMFGGQQSSAITGDDREALHRFYDVSMMVFRLALIDDYPFFAMKSIDQAMTFILVIAFLLLMGVVGLNLFIALLSNVVEQVYEASQANAILQQALLIRSYHQKVLFFDTYKMYHKYLHKHCNPYKIHYEDKSSLVADKKKSPLLKIVERLDDIRKQIDKMNQEIGDLKTRIGGQDGMEDIGNTTEYC